MKDPDEQKTVVKIDIENVVKCLFQAYPNAKWIALNASLNEMNEMVWKEHWYFAGFIDQPVYKNFCGFPAWVAYDYIETPEDEWALFFLHISSKDHWLKDIELQKSDYDFISPRWLCWHIEDDGSITQFAADEIEVKKNEMSKDMAAKLFKSMKDKISKGVLK